MVSVDELLSRTLSKLGIVHVRSAINPLLWLVGIASPTAWIAAYLFGSTPAISEFLVGIGALPIIAVIIAYTYFMVADPKRLQSEGYQIRSQMIELIQTKGGKISVEPANLESIANPSIPQIEHKDNGGSQ